jgi:hypothetical protein
VVRDIDKALGIVVRTSAEAGEGPWFPGMETTWGSLWARTADGEHEVGFDLGPGGVMIRISPEMVEFAKKRASALNTIVDVTVKRADGARQVITFIAPRGHLKRALAHIGVSY